MKVKDFISEANWTTGALARDQDNNAISEWPYSPAACKWCLTGMILYLYRDDKLQIKILDRLREYLEPDIKKRPAAISRWNDSQGRTWEDVRALACELDI